MVSSGGSGDSRLGKPLYDIPDDLASARQIRQSTALSCEMVDCTTLSYYHKLRIKKFPSFRFRNCYVKSLERRCVFVFSGAAAADFGSVHIGRDFAGNYSSSLCLSTGCGGKRAARVVADIASDGCFGSTLRQCFGGNRTDDPELFGRSGKPGVYDFTGVFSGSFG